MARSHGCAAAVLAVAFLAWGAAAGDLERGLVGGGTRVGGGGGDVEEDEVAVGYVCPNLTALAEGRADPGGWVPPDADSPLESAICTIERRHVHDLRPEEFLSEYWNDRPVILEGFDRNWLTSFPAMCAKETLLAYYGELPIVLSSANKNSYEKKTVPLTEYLAEYMNPPPVVQLGNTTWYHFGNNDHGAWPELFNCYQRPTDYMHDPSFFAYSFGIGAGGTGVPFHTHGPVFNEVIYGRKRWWLKAPGPEPAFEPNESALQWLYTYYSRGDPAALDGLLECTVGAGEVLFVPSMWHHSTLNIGDTIFMATFV